MRIELNAGGLGGVAAISGFHTDFSGLISKSKKMLATFQVVKQQSYGMNGGIGNLQTAVNEIENRISAEESKVTAIKSVEKKTNSFLELALKTDIQASIHVNRSKSEFYRVNPWAKPPAPPKEKNFLQKAGDWICKKGEQFVEGVKNAKDAVVNWGKSVADSVSKAWNSAVKWCKENKDFLKQIAVEIAIGAAVIGLAFVTGGASLAITVAAAAGTGAALGGAGSAIEHYMEHGTTKGMLKAAVGGAAKGFMTGSITGFVGGHVGIVGKTMKLGKGATTALGAITNGVASAGGELIHAAADGNGITKEERGDIIKSGIIGTISGGLGAYKGYGKETTLDKLRYNDEFTEQTTQSIKKTAIRNMKQGLPNSIYNAQEAIRDLSAFNQYLTKKIIKSEVVDKLIDGGAELIVDILS